MSRTQALRISLHSVLGAALLFAAGACSRSHDDRTSTAEVKAAVPNPLPAASAAPNSAANATNNANAMNNANATGSAASDGTETLLRAGAQLPDVSARTQKGETIKFSDLRGKPVVVYFYPKDDTPGCTVEAKDIRDTWKDIQSLGATVIGVSVDDDASHKAFAEKYGLPFLLVADTDHHVASAFGVPLRNGRARRVSFVFDKTGRLTKVFPDVTPQGHGGELLAALRGS